VGESLFLALGVALSPLPLLAILLFLGGNRPPRDRDCLLARVARWSRRGHDRLRPGRRAVRGHRQPTGLASGGRAARRQCLPASGRTNCSPRRARIRRRSAGLDRSARPFWAVPGCRSCAPPLVRESQEPGVDSRCGSSGGRSGRRQPRAHCQRGRVRGRGCVGSITSTRRTFRVSGAAQTPSSGPATHTRASRPDARHVARVRDRCALRR
jgi:hypothetical protein